MKEGDRLDRLEEEIAHMRLTNDELSNELLVHMKKIESLEKHIIRLDGRFKGIEESLDGPIENQKPPHW